MLIGLFVIALVLTCAPIAAAVVVTVASRREDADWTLAGAAAPGPLRGLARQILDFHSEVDEWEKPKSYSKVLTGRRASRQTRPIVPLRPLEDASLGKPERVAPRSAAGAR